MTFLHDDISLYELGKCWHAILCGTSSSLGKTQLSRQPIRVVGTIKSELSRLYAMASSFTSRIETARVGARGIGQLALAGLAIST